MDIAEEQFYLKTNLLILSYKNNLASIVVNFIAMSAFYYQIAALNINYIELWFYCTAILMAVRIGLDFRFKKVLSLCNHSLSAKSYQFWKNCYVIGSFLGGLSWAVVSVISLPGLSIENCFYLSIIVNSLGGGATGVLAASRVVGKVFILLILIPAYITLLFVNPALNTLGILGILICLVMLSIHHNNYLSIVKGLKLSFKNDDLLSSLKTQNLQILNLNKNLEKRVKERTRTLEKMALTDKLTQLNNREGFIQQCEQLEIHDKNLKFYFFDLDRFKQINDSRGHEVGDLVLQHISQLILNLLPEKSVVGRWGGDEFVICSVSDLNQSGVIDNLYNAFSESLFIKNKLIDIRMTIGIAFYPEDVNNIEEAIHAADLAATYLKQQGDRGKILRFNSSIARINKLSKVLINIFNDKAYPEFFYLEYQPIVDCNGAIYGFEALSRFAHPKLDAVGPAQFIPIIETSGRIIEYGYWILESALSYVKKLYPIKPNIHVSINVSPIQLKDKSFYPMIEDLLNKYQLPATVLSLEITEMFLEDVNLTTIIAQLELLQKLGVSIHIDDFGTGYSSLSRLRTLPVNTLKIDRSFVNDMNEQDDGLIKGILSIAEQFKLNVIVEGVETEKQFQQLKAMGCLLFQGYYFAKSLGVDDIDKVLLEKLPVKNI